MKANLLSLLWVLATAALWAQPETGIATYYSDKFQGNTTASGEKYDKDLLTAAHKTHPFGTVLRVTRLDNDKSVIVRVNDRGPYYRNHVIDLSRKAAASIDLIEIGKAQVKIEVVRTADATQRGVGKSSAASSAPKININNPRIPVEGLYEVKSQRLPAKGFAVQVGVYSDFTLLMKHMNVLIDNKLYNVATSIERNDKGELLYKILIGPYDKLAEATARQSMLKKSGFPNCFIVDLEAKK